MAQTKRKTSTKTTKKSSAARTQSRKKAATRTTKCREITGKEKMHVYIVAAMSIMAGLLLCADVAMVIV